MADFSETGCLGVQSADNASCLPQELPKSTPKEPALEAGTPRGLLLGLGKLRGKSPRSSSRQRP